MIAWDWDAFTQWLRDRLRALEDGEIFVLDGPPDSERESGSSRYVQFCAFNDAESIHCEVVSNSYLPEPFKHSIDDLLTLRVAGWSLPTALPGEGEGSGSYNLFLDVDKGDLAVASEAVCVALRDVWSMDPYAFSPGCIIPAVTSCFQLPTPSSDEDASI